MDKRIYAALDSIHAGPELKRRVKMNLSQTLSQNASRRKRLRIAAVAVCMLLLTVISGSWVYFTPTAQISIDINPSVQLNVNRFDRVVSAKGLNEEGDALLGSLSLWLMDYEGAVTEILESEAVSSLLSQEEVLTIGVTGKEETQCERMLSGLSSCIGKEANAHCYYADESAMEAARELGLSYGQYRAYLELLKWDPTVTAQDIEGMTVRQIRDWIESLQGGEGETSEDVESSNGSGNGHQHQHGKDQ